MLDPITPEQRAELRRLHEAATPGPWSKRGSGVYFHNSWPYAPVVDDDRIGPENALLIAAARNALPALLDAADERDALRERLAEVTRDRDALLSACEAVRADKFASLSASAWAGILSALAGR